MTSTPSPAPEGEMKPVRDRSQWSFQSTDDDHEGELTVTVRDNGQVLFEIEEEQAVDSYNYPFNCTALLPPDKVRELAAMLSLPAPLAEGDKELIAELRRIAQQTRVTESYAQENVDAAAIDEAADRLEQLSGE